MPHSDYYPTVAASLQFTFERHASPVDYTAGSPRNGFLIPHIGYLLRGSGTFVSPQKTLQLSAGDAVYIPALYPYRSYWKGPVEFYTVVVGDSRFDDAFFAFQKLSLPQLRPAYEALAQALKEGRDGTRILARFLDVYAPIAERLVRAERTFDPALSAARAYLTEHAAEPVRVAEAARLAGLSESRFFVRFKEATGYSPMDYKNLVRVRGAVLALKEGRTVEDVCFSFGFSSPAFFRRLLKKFTGATPSGIRAGADLL